MCEKTKQKICGNFAFIPLIIFLIRKFIRSNSFLYRFLEKKKKNDSNLIDKFNEQQIQIKDLQQQNQQIEKEIDKLIKLTNHLQLSIRQDKNIFLFS